MSFKSENKQLMMFFLLVLLIHIFLSFADESLISKKITELENRSMHIQNELSLLQRKFYNATEAEKHEFKYKINDLEQNFMNIQNMINMTKNAYNECVKQNARKNINKNCK